MRPNNPIEHLAAVVWCSPRWREVLLVMLQTAFDAGGHEADQSCISVAGFISSADDWIRFDEAWRKRLAADGLTYFRMSEFAQFSGQFSDRDAWKEPRRRTLLGNLIEIIQAHAYHKFGVSVVNAEFGRLADDMREHFRLTAYVLAGRTCAGHVRQWALEERMGQAPIAYIFEAGDRHRGRLMERMEQDAFPPPIFRPKKDVVRDGVLCPGFTPLQAADILAYEHFLATKRWEATRWAFGELDKYFGSYDVYRREHSGTRKSPASRSRQPERER